jgi:hypothetical protein
MMLKHDGALGNQATGSMCQSHVNELLAQAELMIDSCILGGNVFTASHAHLVLCKGEPRDKKPVDRPADTDTDHINSTRLCERCKVAYSS